MTRIFIACICIFCLFQWSCKNKIGGNDPILNELETSFNTSPNEDNFNKLINKYLEMIQSAPKGSDLSELFIKASNICSKMDKPDQEIVFINNLVKNNPNHPNIKEYIFKMIQLLFKTERQTTAEIMALCYVKAYPNDPKIAELSSKLPKINNPEEYIFEIGKSIFADTTTGFNEKNAMVYVDACEAYAMVLPKDAQTPEYIFKAAETSNTLKTYEKSFSLYDWIIDKYPTHERAPISLFMKGFLFDGTLKDSANASKYYTEFLTKYPNNSFAKDAELLKSNLGKSDEQVLDELMKKKAQ
ncbi:MAG: hypothetical protein IPK88_11170 [Saprospiraceae bacterium]|jgi:outer membrane protein assembly factor BamD (BamD/ComL family)|uniref:Outer membrane lipoprotein BamD-like domain-containing protein n=1 Tax=Candidatus Defluviibacterium haderslevense TaxID=2981993 RepID=A0A9D7XFQ4_9BACT|nr:hypothetical protein [Candidatus Defluviibacterium haderslevense]MBK9719170.1 hypothetical protein [Candidatus Defluviibacterium haderslevense]MCC7025781.1 hypothetical protein [Saprospiraceae bacterium]